MEEKKRKFSLIWSWRGIEKILLRKSPKEQMTEWNGAINRITARAFLTNKVSVPPDKRGAVERDFDFCPRRLMN